MVNSTCTFVPLSSYDWSLNPALVPVAIPWNPTAYCLITAFCAISLWMTIELTLQVFFTFKRHKSLYFWSILICTWGITFHVIGLILKLFNEGNWIISSIIFKIGWVGNVTGFSFVLYSRLGLVVRNRKLRRAVLIMIITDAFCLHTPIIIFDFGISSPHPHIWIMPMKIMEKIQVIGFSLQESTIALLYIYHTRDFLKDIYTKQTHQVMHLLIFAQLVAIVFDIALITVDWENMFTLKVTIHPFVYAVKLKLEFIVLNQLLALIKHGVAPSSFPAPDEESPEASDGPSFPRTGKHVSFLSSQTATATGDKKGLKVMDTPQFNGRDMEYDRPVIAPAEYTDPDIILPSSLPSPAPGTIAQDTILPSTALSPDANHLAPDTIVPTHTPVPEVVHSGSQTHTPTVRRSFESHRPLRSFSDPTPLSLAFRDHETDEVVAELERQYLGRFGMGSLLPR